MNIPHSKEEARMRSDATMQDTLVLPAATPTTTGPTTAEPKETVPARRTSERIKKRKATPLAVTTRAGRKRQKLSAPTMSIEATASTTTTEVEGSAVSMPMLTEVKELVDQLKELKEELKALKDQPLPSSGDPDSDDTGGSKKAVTTRRRRRAMSREQKERLHVRICTLSGDKLQGLIDLVAREATEALVAPSETEVEIDLSVLPSAKLWLLYDYCAAS